MGKKTSPTSLRGSCTVSSGLRRHDKRLGIVDVERLEIRGRAFHDHLFAVHINGRSMERRVPGNRFGREAAQLAKDIEAKLVIPCHFEMFEFNTESPDEFIHECRRLGQPFKVLRCGEQWDSQG